MPRQAPGFTLIELLVSIAVLGILLAIASPSFASLQRRSAVTSAHNLLLTGFASARSHAVSFGRLTTICPGSPATGCRSDSIWEEGWLVFVDENGNGRLDATDTIVFHENRGTDPVRIRSSKGRPRATFRPDGSAGGTNLTLRLCVGEMVQGAIVLSNVGRARSAGAGELAAMPGCD